jgi:hypothetical protein
LTQNHSNLKSHKPILIQAKRNKLYDFDKISKRVVEGNLQKAGMERDIFKLNLIRKYNRTNPILLTNKTYADFLTYLLIWGEGNRDFDIENDLINRLNNAHFLDKNKCTIRRIPLHWTNTNAMEVTKFIWIALLEVNGNC